MVFFSWLRHFKSGRDTIFLFSKLQKESTAESVCRVGGRISTLVDEGRKGWVLLTKNMKARAVASRGEVSLLCDPESELRLLVRGREKRRAKIYKWEEEMYVCVLENKSVQHNQHPVIGIIYLYLVQQYSSSTLLPPMVQQQCCCCMIRGTYVHLCEVPW